MLGAWFARRGDIGFGEGRTSHELGDCSLQPTQFQTREAGSNTLGESRARRAGHRPSANETWQGRHEDRVFVAYVKDEVSAGNQQ